jgi:hypothetical protein
MDGLEDRQVRAVLRELRVSRDRVEKILSGRGALGRSPTDFDLVTAARRKAAIEAEIARLERAVATTVGEGSRAAAHLAADAARDVAGVTVGVDARAVAYAQSSAADKVVAVTDLAKAQMRSAITRGLAGGLTMEELHAEIRKALGGGETEARLERIVRTELGNAYGQQSAAQDEVLLERGADVIKVWQASRDGRTRDDHLAIDGQERELDEDFNVGRGATKSTPPGGVGYPAAAPQDPRLPPEQAIQCRCTRVYRRREDAKQPYTRREPRHRAAAEGSANA